LGMPDGSLRRRRSRSARRRLFNLFGLFSFRGPRSFYRGWWLLLL
jgi:hypothetical protein